MQRLLVCVLIASALVASVPRGVARAATPTPTPKSTSTPVPSATGFAAPNAPSDVHVDLVSKVVTWKDNSDNETGFVITYTVRNGEQVSATYRVGSNVTTFAIPSNAPAFDCGHTLEVSVAAVNGTASSPPALFGLASICPPPSSRSGQPRNLPGTGSDGPSRSNSAGRFSAIALLLVVSGTVFLFGSRRARAKQ